jgi:transposase
VLCEFRARLLADGQTERLLMLMLIRLRERGLLGGGGRQRTDATHVMMAARDVHRSSRRSGWRWKRSPRVAPARLAAWVPEDWYLRYAQRGDDWRLPKSQ